MKAVLVVLVFVKVGEAVGELVGVGLVVAEQVVVLVAVVLKRNVVYVSTSQFREEVLRARLIALRTLLALIKKVHRTYAEEVCNGSQEDRLKNREFDETNPEREAVGRRDVNLFKPEPEEIVAGDHVRP